MAIQMKTHMLVSQSASQLQSHKRIRTSIGQIQVWSTQSIEEHLRICSLL